MAQSIQQQLWQASTDGNLVTVRRLLQENPRVDVNFIEADEPGKLDTPLHRACRFGHLEIVKELLAHPEIVANKGNQGDASPFYIACQEGQVEVVRWLLTQERLEVTRPNKNGATPIFIACQNGHVEMAKLLLGDSRTNVNQPKSDGSTPLYFACRNGHLAIVALLLTDPRVDLNLENNRQVVPLCSACNKGHEEVVALLLADPRVDPNAARWDKKTPFLNACQQGRASIVRRMLVDPRVDVRAVDDEGFGPMHAAGHYDHHDLVSLLLTDHRIDPNLTDVDHCTPLWLASQNGHLLVVKHLLASSRDINTKIISLYTNKTAAEQGRQMAIEEKQDDDTKEEYQRSVTNGPLCASLIDDYDRDPDSVRLLLRCDSQIRGHYIGHTFALLVFFADGFLRLKGTASESTRRFFDLCVALPLELQMMVCSRMFASPKDVVTSKDSEPGFRWLARSTTWAAAV